MPAILLAILILIAFVYSWWYYRGTVPPVRGFIRWLLVSLRTFAVSFILLSIASPAAEAVFTIFHKTKTAVLIDTSSSIDNKNDSERLAQSRAALSYLR